MLVEIHNIPVNARNIIRHGSNNSFLIFAVNEYGYFFHFFFLEANPAVRSIFFVLSPRAQSRGIA
jgi:hypothetical protein